MAVQSIGHSPGSQEKEQMGLEFCSSPVMWTGCATLLSMSRQQASPHSPLPFIQLCAAAQLLRLPGGAAKCPAYWLLPESLPFHTQTHPHMLCLAHTLSCTHMRVHSFLHPLCLSPWLLQAHGPFLERRSWSSRVGLFWFLFVALAFWESNLPFCPVSVS